MPRPPRPLGAVLRRRIGTVRRGLWRCHYSPSAGTARHPRSRSEWPRGPRSQTSVNIDVFTLFPGWFDWLRGQRHVANAVALGHSLECVDPRATTPLSGGAVDDTPFGGGAGMVLRVDVMEAALRARYGEDPVTLRERRRGVALTPGGRLLDDALAGG